jgi:hypothetical protein
MAHLHEKINPEREEVSRPSEFPFLFGSSVIRRLSLFNTFTQLAAHHGIFRAITIPS